MPLVRSHAVLLLGVAVLVAPVPRAHAQRMGRCTLDPKTYKSPSGEYELHVDPSTIYGQAEGAYRMTRNGAEVWAGKLAFTLWDAGITDDGTVAGYAYSGGMENYALGRRGDSQTQGKLYVVILDPQGGLRLNAVFPRRGTSTCTTYVDRNVEAFILDAEYDRFIVRMHEGGWCSSSSDTWRIYRLSTGTLVDEFQFAHPEATQRESWFLLAAKPVLGTPLILVNWEYTKWDETGNQRLASGGCFNLIDPAGNSVWELDLPGDYPENFFFESRETGMGAILQTDQGRRFDLRFFKDNQRVSFQVTPAEPDGWQVLETSRTAYVPAPAQEPERKPDQLESMTLPHLGTIELQIDTAPSPEIRDIAYFDVDGRGRIGFLRSKGNRSGSFLLIEPDGTIVWNLGLREVLGGNANLVTCTWLDGARWLLIAQLDATSSGADRPSTRAWWLDSDTQTVTPIDPFTGEGARYVAATHDGGFVVIINPSDSELPESVIRFDREAKERWRFDGAPEEMSASGRSSITVMPDGRVIVSRDYGRGLTVLTAEGKFLKTFECGQFFGRGADGKWLTPSADGSLLWTASYPAGHICLIQLDGTIKQILAVKHRDGRPVEFAPFPYEMGVRIDQQGTMWACDTHSLLRLNADGIVEQVLGEPPDTPTLRSIGGAKIDQTGNIYLAERRNLITHVFDAAGRGVRLLRPNPDDFEHFGYRAIDVAADGRVFVDGLGFSPTGERLGFRKLPGDTEAPNSPVNRVRYRPRGDGYWIVGQEDARLVGEHDTVLVTLKHRPDGRWLDQIAGSAVAPDGSLILAARRMGMARDEAPVLNLYGPSGEPLKTVSLPALEGVANTISVNLAYTGRYVIAGPFGYAKPQYVLLDAFADPPKWYDLGALAPYQDRWVGYWLVNEGKELWLYAEGAHRVERFAVPQASDEPQSAKGDTQNREAKP